MSSLQNNASNMFFPTQANLSLTQQYNSFQTRKIYTTNKQDKQSGYSSTLQKTKQQSQASRQRLISPQLQNIITKIQTFVEDIDSKIQNRVQLVKQVYVNEYKQQVLEMSAQLKLLRQKLDNQVMKERANQKMFYLEEERDFFRHQVIKLNQQMNKLNQDNKSLRKIVQQEKRQSSNYKQIVYGLQQKILKLKNVNIQRNMLLTSSSKNPDSIQKTFKHHSSTIDTNKHFSGANTQRVHNTNKPTKSLQTIQDESQQQMSRTGYRLRASQSLKAYPKLSTPNRQPMRSTVTYPKLTVQKLQKIQGYSQLLERQHIIDECINELKREIYYRNLSVGDRQTRIHFGQTSQVRFQAFTKTDKKELIIKLLSSQKILNEFYHFLFIPNLLGANPHNDNQISSTNQLINHKLDLQNNINGLNSKLSMKKLKFTDPKFNTQTLTNIKTQFNKKIFDIKNNK